MSNYSEWMNDELADYVREVLPEGTRVKMSKKWTKHNKQRPGVVVGYGRRDRSNIRVVHGKQKTAHTYHWSFIIPAPAEPKEGGNP